jgi:hypothetical protein
VVKFMGESSQIHAFFQPYLSTDNMMNVFAEYPVERNQADKVERDCL